MSALLENDKLSFVARQTQNCNELSLRVSALVTTDRKNVMKVKLILLVSNLLKFEYNLIMIFCFVFLNG
jgi:hypothetical protein